MIITSGTYTSDNTDLKIVIAKVQCRTSEYIKVRASLFNKKNDIFYETKNYKIYRENITHWKKVFDTDNF